MRFGSWIGGDRDGNPNVTPEVTRKACLLARWQAADLYLSRDRGASRRAVDDAARSPELRARAPATHTSRIAPCCATSARACSPRATGSKRRRVEAGEGRPPPADVYLEAEALAEPLRLCHRSLVATGDEIIADGRLADVLRRVATFGVTLARLDIRQESDRHTDALDVDHRRARARLLRGVGRSARASSSWSASLPTRVR